MRSRSIILALALLAGALAPACTTAFWAESADEEVADVLSEAGREFDDFRARGLVRPEEQAPEEAETAGEDLSGIPRLVGLREALRIATRRNREYRTQKESLFLAALALTSVENRFSPFFTGTVASLVTDTDRGPRQDRSNLALGVRQVLPTGGELSVTGSGVTNGTPGLDRTYAADLTVSLDQPLLRDAGYETSHEDLTQAWRNVVYAIRDFELFREDFTIRIATRYYNLVRQQREIVNTERNLAARDFLRRQSEEKFKVGLATEVDKLRAAREYLRAKNDLLALRQAYSLALDRFKIDLGLPTGFPLEIRPEEPPYREVPIDLRSAVAAALHNRVDLLTSRDRLEDAERGLRIAANRMLPALDLSGSYTNASGTANSLSRVALGEESVTIGLTLELPLERTSERNELRRAMIEVDRARRDLTLKEDNIILEVRDSHRALKRTEATLLIRKQEIRAAEKEEAAAQIRFEAGEMDNLSVSDARNAVLRAQNAYIADLVNYEIARIQLMRDVGILLLDEHGMWKEPEKP